MSLIVELNASTNMFYLLKHLLLLNLVIFKVKYNNLFFSEILVLDASYVCLMHSCFIENHPIWILEDRPFISEAVLSQLQLAEVLPIHSISPRWQWNGAPIGKRREQSKGVVPQVKPLLPLHLHRSLHGDFKVGIHSVPCLNMNDRAPRDHQLSFEILRTPDTEEIFPQIKLRVNP
jgi:hypothetical protein